MQCQYCGNEFASKGLKNHERSCSQNPDRKPGYRTKTNDHAAEPVETTQADAGRGRGNSVSRVQWKKNLQNQEDLLTTIQFVFPKGIDTKERETLARTLSWISETGKLLEER